LFLTGCADVRSKIQGLDAGADDYLAKPFEFVEPLARVNAVLRRKPEAPHSVLSVNDLSLELETRQLTFDGEKISLTAKEFSLLELFIRNPDRRLSSWVILEAIWPADCDCSEDSVRSSVRHLRRKLSRNGKPSPIETAGKGYMLSSRSLRDRSRTTSQFLPLICP
jgi:two-component system response regulator MprA